MDNYDALYIIIKPKLCRILGHCQGSRRVEDSFPSQSGIVDKYLELGSSLRHKNVFGVDFLAYALIQHAYYNDQQIRVRDILLAIVPDRALNTSK